MNSSAPLDDRDTRAAVLAERVMLAKLRGGCLAPIGAYGRVERQTLQLTGVVLSGDGKTRLSAEKSAELAQPQALGKAVADDLLAQGAGRLLDAQRDNR